MNIHDKHKSDQMIKFNINTDKMLAISTLDMML